MDHVDLIIERHYHEGVARDGSPIHKVERVTWRHVPAPMPMWRWKSRRFRSPKLVQEGVLRPLDESKARPLPDPPELAPNRWIWVQASHPAADLGSIEPDEVLANGSHFHSADSPWWSYYEIPLRSGVVLT